MPSDLTVYTPDGRPVRVSRRAFHRVWEPKGYRLTPPLPHQSLERLTVPELRDLAEQRGLSTHGFKRDLVDRLQHSD